MASVTSRWQRGHVVTAAGLAVWVVACDLWVKVLAHAAGCVGDVQDMTARVAMAHAPPSECAAVSLLGDTLVMRSAATDAGPASLLPGTGGAWVGGLVLTIAMVLTILVWRWRWRNSGDALALGALWGGAIALALPRLSGGIRTTTLELFTLPTGIGDLALAWALVWLSWRAIAEARA